MAFLNILFFLICHSEALNISIFNAKTKAAAVLRQPYNPRCGGRRAVTSWQPHIITAGIEISCFCYGLPLTSSKCFAFDVFNLRFQDFACRGSESLLP